MRKKHLPNSYGLRFLNTLRARQILVVMLLVLPFSGHKVQASAKKVSAEALQTQITGKVSDKGGLPLSEF